MSSVEETMACLMMHQAVETESSGQVLRAKIVTMENNSVVLKFLDPAALKQGQVLNLRPAGHPDKAPVPVRIEWTLETAVD